MQEITFIEIIYNLLLGVGFIALFGYNKQANRIKKILDNLEKEIDRRLNIIEETLEDCDDKDKGRVTSIIRSLIDVKDRLHIIENDPDRKQVKEFIEACDKQVEDLLNECRKILKDK